MGGDEARAGEFTCAGANEKRWNCARARKQFQVDSGERGQQPQGRRPSGDSVSISVGRHNFLLISPLRYYSVSMPPTGSSDGSYQRRWWACRRFVPAADQATNCFMCPSACYLENYVISIVSLGYGRVIASILPAKIVNHSLFFSWALLENLTDWWCPIRVLFAQINEVNSIQLLIVPVDSLLAILATNYSILVTRA